MMNKIILFGKKMGNKVAISRMTRDPGVNALLIEAGLVIIGVALILIFNTSATDYVKQVVTKCLDKSLAILS